MRQYVLCFVSDPLSMGPQKALETVGNKLQEQYERWQPRVRRYCSIYFLEFNGAFKIVKNDSYMHDTISQAMSVRR